MCVYVYERDREMKLEDVKRKRDDLKEKYKKKYVKQSFEIVRTELFEEVASSFIRDEFKTLNSFVLFTCV